MKVGAWLERFRRPAGVPAAAGDDVAPELLPVFAALDEIDAAAQDYRAGTERLVAARLEAARREAERTHADWQRRADEARAQAEAERRAELSAEARAIEAAGEEEAERLLAAGRQRIQPLVAAVVAAITENRV